MLNIVHIEEHAWKQAARVSVSQPAIAQDSTPRDFFVAAEQQLVHWLYMAIDASSQSASPQEDAPQGLLEEVGAQLNAQFYVPLGQSATAQGDTPRS